MAAIFISCVFILCFFLFSLLIPGMLLLRRTNLPPQLLLPAAFIVSATVLFILAFGVFVSSGSKFWLQAYAILSVALPLLFHRQLASTLECPIVQRSLQIYFIFVLWVFSLTALTTIIANGDWFGDWFEHYLRAQYFIVSFENNLLPPDSFNFAERPPLANFLTGYLMQIGGQSFAAYQFTTLLLSALIILAALPLAPTPHSRAAVLLFVLFFAFHPAIVQHQLYPWTRSLTAFFVVSAFSLELISDPGSCRIRRVLALLASTLACLTHYSALVWIIPFYLMLACTQKPGDPGRTSTGTIAGILLSSIPVLLWFEVLRELRAEQDFWVHNVFARGIRQVSITDYLTNILHAWKEMFFPAPFASYPWPDLDSVSSLTGIGNRLFYNYQCTLPGILALTGLAAIGCRLLQNYRKERRVFGGSTQKQMTCVILGAIFLAPTVYPFGFKSAYAHVSLLPLGIFGAAYSYRAFVGFSRSSRFILALTLLLDFALGIALQVYTQHRTLGTVSAARAISVLDGREPLNTIQLENLHLARSRHLILLGEELFSIRSYTFALSGVMFLIFLWVVSRSLNTKDIF